MSVCLKVYSKQGLYFGFSLTVNRPSGIIQAQKALVYYFVFLKELQHIVNKKFFIPKPCISFSSCNRLIFCTYGMVCTYVKSLSHIVKTDQIFSAESQVFCLWITELIWCSCVVFQGILEYHVYLYSQISSKKKLLTIKVKCVILK